MNTEIYLFFSATTLILFFSGLLDWSNTKHKTLAVFPMLLSGILSILLFATTWSVEYASGGVIHDALSPWEEYAFAMIWFLLFAVSIILTIVMYFDKVRGVV